MDNIDDSEGLKAQVETVLYSSSYDAYGKSMRWHIAASLCYEKVPWLCAYAEAFVSSLKFDEKEPQESARDALRKALDIAESLVLSDDENTRDAVRLLKGRLNEIS